jgi:hypothetical protein
VGVFAPLGGCAPHDSVHAGSAGHFRDARLAFSHLHLDAKLIAGAHGFAEFGFFDGRQQHKFVLAVGDLAEHQNSGDLRHGFDDEDAGHHGKIGKMAGKERFGDGHVLDADDALRLQFLNAVDKEKRIAVRKDLLDPLNIHDRHAVWLL